MEGPSLRAIAEELSFLEKANVAKVSGNTKAGKEQLKGKEIKRIYAVGKRLVIEFDSLAVVIHFLMFGSHRLNERREGMVPLLSLSLNGSELNFYNCSVKIIAARDLAALDQTSDILNPEFDRKRAHEEVRRYKGMIADLLLDQDVFGGVGNIIKNEALYAAAIHPASASESIPIEKTEALIEETIRFSNAFYLVKKRRGLLKPILKVYRKRICDQCRSPIQAKKMGNRRRMTFFCPNCQVLY
jgi:endonuclease-8